MSVGLLDGLSAALSIESEAVRSDPERQDPPDPCALGEHDPRASAMRAVSRLAAADPFLARSLASSVDGFFPRVAAVAAAEGPVPGDGPGSGSGVRVSARPGAMWFAAHAACALAVWCAPARETADGSGLEVSESPRGSAAGSAVIALDPPGVAMVSPAPPRRARKPDTGGVDGADEV